MKSFIIAATAALVVSTPSFAQKFPTTPPAPAPVRPATFPPFQQHTLSNGLRLVVVERHDAPVVSMALSVPAGLAYDPAGKEGLAELASLILPKGAAGRSADEITSRIERAGGSFSAGVDADFITLFANSLASGADRGMQLIAEAVLAADFPAPELELARGRLQSGLQLAMAQPGFIADNAAKAVIYGPAHPYGRSRNPESIGKVTRDDLVAWQRQRLVPRGSVLIITGDITAAQARRLAERALGAWSGTAQPLAIPNFAPKVNTGSILLIDMPGSAQSTIHVANAIPGPNDARRIGSVAMNHFLGGTPSARLFRILREEKGWTYGANSSITEPLHGGLFSAVTSVRTEVTDSALAELLRQLHRVTKEPVPQEELDRSKAALVGAFPLTVQTAEQVAAQVRTNLLLGRPDSTLRTYRTSLDALKPSDIVEAARAYVRPDSAVIIVVGDASKIADTLRRIGPVELVDKSGKPAMAAPQAASATLDLSRLTREEDHYTVILQGQPMGSSVRRMVRSQGGFQFVQDFEIAGAMTQHTEIDADGKRR